MTAEKVPAPKSDATSGTDGKKGSAEETLDRFREKVNEIPPTTAEPKD